MRVQEPYKKANRKFHPEDSAVRVGSAVIGGGSFGVIAGPCSVESEEQVTEVAKAVQASGASMLRGGAFKPRTSPYSFQGMGTPGLDLLVKAKAATGLPIESQTVEQLVTAGITTVAALVAWWKNNSFTPAALQADQTYDKLKAQGK